MRPPAFCCLFARARARVGGWVDGELHIRHTRVPVCRDSDATMAWFVDLMRDPAFDPGPLSVRYRCRNDAEHACLRRAKMLFDCLACARVRIARIDVLVVASSVPHERTVARAEHEHAFQVSLRGALRDSRDVKVVMQCFSVPVNVLPCPSITAVVYAYPSNEDAVTVLYHLARVCPCARAVEMSADARVHSSTCVSAPGADDVCAALRRWPVVRVTAAYSAVLCAALQDCPLLTQVTCGAAACGACCWPSAFRSAGPGVLPGVLVACRDVIYEPTRTPLPLAAIVALTDEPALIELLEMVHRVSSVCTAATVLHVARMYVNADADSIGGEQPVAQRQARCAQFLRQVQPFVSLASVRGYVAAARELCIAEQPARVPK